jgi:uncharacterized protein (TIGR00725 family)
MPYLAVSGPGNASDREYDAARAAGEWAAHNGHVVVCGGLGGVMEAAARGAREAGGTSVGLLPGSSRADANRYLSVVIPTGMGEMRNALLVRSADAVLCIGGSWGTLSELALAVRTGVPVVSLWSWAPPDDGPTVADTLDEALAALETIFVVRRSS